MYASIVTGSVQPGKMNEFLTTWLESVKPMVEEFPGFKNIYVSECPRTLSTDLGDLFCKTVEDVSVEGVDTSFRPS